MRAGVIPTFKRSVQDIYLRITLNRLTLCFFLFSFILCFTQGIIQSFLFHLDDTYESLALGITSEANIPDKAVPSITGSFGSLGVNICTEVPMYFPESCTPIFPSDSSAPVGRQTLDVKARVMFKPNTTNLHTNFNISGVHVEVTGGDTFDLPPMCSGVMLYIRQMFNKTKREDIGWICMQFWLFLISCVAIHYNSIPHLLTVLATRVTATAWSAYAIWRAVHRKRVTDELTTIKGSACELDFTAGYFTERIRYESADLILNLAGLIISAYFTITLLKVYNRQTFKVIGASPKIERIQTFFNAVRCVLQFEVFMVLVAMALWIDELSNGPIAKVSKHVVVYRVGVIGTAVTLWPWIALGWYSIRRESNIGIYLFMAYSFALTFVWSFMYYSYSYRWTFYDWPFFGCFATASLILLVASFVLGLICRLNFGKGLKQYLNAESAINDLVRPDVFTHGGSDVEKGLDLIPEDADPAHYLKKHPTLEDASGYETHEIATLSYSSPSGLKPLVMSTKLEPRRASAGQ